MGYGVRHRDGSSDDDAPVSSFGALYDELNEVDGEHGDVAVIDDETGWAVTAYRTKLVILQCLADGKAFHLSGVGKPAVIEMWVKLANRDLDGLRALPWKDGFKQL